MKVFDQQMFVALTYIDGVVVKIPIEEQKSFNRHDWVTKLTCVQSSCNASAEIHDASDPSNIHRYTAVNHHNHKN